MYKPEHTDRNMPTDPLWIHALIGAIIAFSGTFDVVPITLKSHISCSFFPSPRSSEDFSHCLTGCKVICHFIILCRLNYITNILSLINLLLAAPEIKQIRRAGGENTERKMPASAPRVCVCV